MIHQSRRPRQYRRRRRRKPVPSVRGHAAVTEQMIWDCLGLSGRPARGPSCPCLQGSGKPRVGQRDVMSDSSFQFRPELHGSASALGRAFNGGVFILIALSTRLRCGPKTNQGDLSCRKTLGCLPLGTVRVPPTPSRTLRFRGRIDS